MKLTTEERNKFAIYLEEQAHDNRLLQAQLEKIGGQKDVLEKFRVETAACLIVASILRTTEAVEIKKENSKQ